jgi:hypothetical protein
MEKVKEVRHEPLQHELVRELETQLAVMHTA